MSKRSLEEFRDSAQRSPDPDNNGILPIHDLLSPGEEEHGQSSGPTKKPRNFIATVVSNISALVAWFYGATELSGPR
jgi:hypothetical protein